MKLGYTPEQTSRKSFPTSTRNGKIEGRAALEDG